MLKNYFTVAWRHLTKNRAYTIINITGLATGMAIALLIGLWIADEFSYDHFFTNHKRIARGMVTQSSKGGGYDTGPVIAEPMGQTFHDQYKDLFSRTALTDFPSNNLVSHGDKVFQTTTLWTQKDFPAILGLPILRGNAAAIADPSTALISQQLATALFGNTDPMGQTIKLDNTLPLSVGGVFADIPKNSSLFGLEVIKPWSNQANAYYNQNTNWNDHNGFLYVELQPGITAEQATARVHLVPTPFINTNREEALIYPFDKDHLYGDFEKGQPTGTGAIRFVWLFGLIGGFVLLLACINFMNLSTARSEKRAREVGIRKTLGSLTGNLITQFLSESILVALLSLVLAIFIAAIALPAFNQLAAKDIHMPYTNPIFWCSVIAFAVFTGLLAGSYPAFYLVYRQIMYTKDRPVGYSREGLVTVGMNTPELNQHYEALRTELLEQGIAANVGASNLLPTGFTHNNALDWRGKRPDQAYLDFNNVNVSPDFGRTIGWTILQGRDFSRTYLTDSSAGHRGAASTRSDSPVAFAGSAILNDTAAKLIGIKDPVGETVTFFGKQYHIIGVVANMLTNSPYEPIAPAIFVGGSYVSNIIIRINSPRKNASATSPPSLLRWRSSSPVSVSSVWPPLSPSNVRKRSASARSSVLGW